MFLQEDKMLDMAQGFGDGNVQKLNLEQSVATYDSKTEMVIYYELKTSEVDDCRRGVECVSIETCKAGEAQQSGRGAGHSRR